MKYPRTPHASWSAGYSLDDEHSDINLTNFTSQDLIVTEKLDGETCGFSRDQIHARSVDSGYQAPWQTAMRKRWEEMRHNIPEGFWFYGECMYATHSIEYEKIPDLIFIFAVVTPAFDGRSYVIPFDMMEDICKWYSLKTAPVMRRINANDGFIEYERRQRLIKIPIPEKSEFGGPCEGYVIRRSGHFLFDDFRNNVMKVVRKDHVLTDKHWTKTWKKANLKL